MEWVDDEGRLHRDNGMPARVSLFQQQSYRHGLLHREIMPAVKDVL